jgi:hypothetical protein
MDPPQVWATCAVNDHQRPGAFVREVLLFDRIVVPYPDTEEERLRWHDPNPADPLETWEPESLDELLGVVGTQKKPGYGGARLAWTAPWSHARWVEERTRREVADIVAVDAFAGTRSILAMGEDLPKRVEAVASYPSGKAWWEETQPAPEPPGDPTAATALVMLARPFLLPRVELQDRKDILVEAVELSRDDAFAKARTAYHNFVRDYVGPLQGPDAEVDAGRIRDADMTFAEEQLQAQRAALGRDQRKVWSRTEWAMMIVGASAQAGLAAVAALPVVGVAAVAAQFLGYVAGKRVEAPDPRPLNGASLFVAAERGLSV